MNDERDGQGKLYRKDGFIEYEGGWDRGRKHGKGVQTDDAVTLETAQESASEFL